MRHVELQHLERASLVDAQQVPQTERRRAHRQRDDVVGRASRQTRKGLHLAARSEDGIVVERHQEAELRIDATQQCVQVVVLAEEGVEAALHLEALAVGVSFRPRSRAPTEKRLAFDERDTHAALGQHGRCRDAGDSPTDDHDAMSGFRLLAQCGTESRC